MDARGWWIWGAVVLLASPATAGNTPPEAGAASSAVEERARAAADAYEGAEQAFEAGLERLDAVYVWSVRLAESRRAAGDPEAMNAHLERMKGLYDRVAQRVERGTLRSTDAAAARFYMFEARVWVER
ncbi:MAG: hypothetical protein R3F61_14265 [Myxococcota bacterium]